MDLDKRKARYYLKKLRHLNVWYLLILALIFAGVSIYALRQNNLTMLRLKDKVVLADQQNGDTETALRDLRQYVYGHMNTNLSSGPNAIKPPIQLKYRYDRLVQAEKDRISLEAAKVYTDAQASCETLFPGSVSGGPRVPCVEQYVASHQVVERVVPDSLYKFDFVSPSWSPDLAGWSLILTVLFTLLFTGRYSLEHWLKKQLRQ